MIEMLISLSTIIILSTLTLTYFTNHKRIVSFDHQYAQIRSIIEEAKAISINEHKRIDLLITDKTIGYKDQNKVLRNLILLKDYYFTNIKDIYFNKNGNINQGNHINLCNSSSCKKIVFNVGSGEFYVQ